VPGYAQDNNLSDLPGLTRISQSVAQGVDIFCTSAAGRGTPLNFSLCGNGPRGAATAGTLSQSDAATILQQIGYERSLAYGTHSVEIAYTQFTNVSARLAALRSAITGTGLRRFGIFQDNAQPLGTLVASLAPFAAVGAALPGQELTSSSRLGVFANGNFTFGSQDTTGGGEPGFDFHTINPTLGVDYRLTNNVLLGVALGYTNTNLSFDARGGNLDADGYSITVYGTYYIARQGYIDGLLTFGWHDYSATRNIVYNFIDRNNNARSVNQAAHSDTDGSSFAFSLSAGYDFQYGALTYGPVARLHYTSADIDGYREGIILRPGNTETAQNFTVGNQDVTSLTGALGVQAAYALSTSYGVWIPHIRFEWEHEFENNSRQLTASLVQDPGRTVFRIITDGPDRNYFNLTLGLSGTLRGGLSGFIAYETVLGLSDVVRHNFGLGLRLEF